MVEVKDLLHKKEFYNLSNVEVTNKDVPIGYIDYEYLKNIHTEGLSLQGHQIFLKNLFNPHTNYKRLLMYHSTGTGKTLAIISIAEMYIKYFKRMRSQPNFFIIGFTESIIVRELLKFTHFGYITDSEKSELDRLRYSALEKDIFKRRGLKSMLKRRITDKMMGGFYKFFGYQKFAYDLFKITQLGVENNITYSDIYKNSDTFYDYIEDQINKKNIHVNRSLVESLKYSFIACDEIHNVYNSKAKNNRGMAIDYVLRLLEKEDPESAPKVIYASATPLTGNASEIVDLMNILIPNQTFKREEFFKNDEILPGALKKIGEICNGYVSFLRDFNTKEYPERIIEGSYIKDIPYLKFIKCPMSKLMENTVDYVKGENKDYESMLSSDMYTLYDIVFPNPDSKQIGIYTSTKVVGLINTASKEWKEKNGIFIEEPNIIYGEFLKINNIGKYSSKYEELLYQLIDILDRGEKGKVIVYHYYINISGIFLINEMLLQNGFLDDKTAPLSNTRCSICGVSLEKHKNKDHSFKPVRVLMLHGDISNSEGIISSFNDKNNVNGNEYKILLGTRVIHEGIDFNCVRFMYILSIPRDISTLIQVFGRAIRRRSHYMLPLEYRNVYIYILVSTFSNNKISPEVYSYKKKMENYIKIQLVERELRQYSIDNFINYSKMQINDKPTLDGLPYKPNYTSKDIVINKDPFTTFTAFDYSIEEENIIINILKKLFTLRPIWKEEDLWYNVKNPFLQIKTQYNHSTFNKDNFYLALNFLVNGVYIEDLQSLDMNEDNNTPYINIGNEVRRVIHQSPYYILCPTDILGIPLIDYDSYMRMDITEVSNSISITDFVRENINDELFNKFLNNYYNDYITNPLLSLAMIRPAFHYLVCKKYISGEKIKNIQNLIDIYIELEAMIFYDSFITPEIADSYGISNKKDPIGFKIESDTFIYVKGEWTKIPTSLLRLKESTEQLYIGFTKLTAGKMDLKLRLGMGYSKSYTDKRKVDRGRSCITLSSYTIKQISNFLSFTSKKTKSTCDIILEKLLEKERKEVAKAKPKKYFYFYWETLPTL